MSRPRPANDPDSAPSGVATGRRPTISDVAALADVSKKTVSRVINNHPSVQPETRERVNRMIAETGYIPDPQARALASGHSSLIGLIYESLLAPSMMVMPLGMIDALRGTGCELVVHPSNMASPNFLDDLRDFILRRRLRGLVLTQPVSEDERVTALLDELDCAYVRIGSPGVGAPGRLVNTNDWIGGRLAALHLAELGHTRIAVVPSPGGRATLDKRAGFELGLERFNLALDPANVFNPAFGFEGGCRAGEALLARRPRPTAVFCDNDEIAAGVLRACQLAGVPVPEALSIVGYGDFRVAPATWPPLTTIHTTTREVGRLAIEVLLGAPPAEISPPSLVVRGSTSSPPSRA